MAGTERRRHHAESCKRKRSVVKAVTYRGIIVCPDFLVIYLLTGKAMTAAAFMIVINIYTTVAYFLHQRVWGRHHVGPGASEGNLIPLHTTVNGSSSGSAQQYQASVRCGTGGRLLDSRLSI